MQWYTLYVYCWCIVFTKRMQGNKEICIFHAFLQLKETAGRVRLRLENSICDSLSIKVSLCLLCLEKRQNPSHIFKPRKDTKEYVPYIIQVIHLKYYKTSNEYCTFFFGRLDHFGQYVLKIPTFEGAFFILSSTK